MKRILGALSCAIFITSSAQAKSIDPASMLEKEGCMHCHSLDGEGGMIGPPFDNIAKFRSQKFIQDKLSKKRIFTDSKHIYPVPADLMNHVSLKEETAREIAKYLVDYKSKSNWTAKGHGLIDNDEIPLGSNFKPHPVSKESRMGLSIYQNKGCAACHSINTIGGRMGPALDGVGARRSRKFIENRINAGATVSYADKEFKPSSYMMPSMNLSQKDVRLLTDFLLTLPVKNDK